jgi:hypothetical protein
MKESARVTAVIVVIKISILLLFIYQYLGHFQPVNWSNFMPNGWTGALEGTASSFCRNGTVWAEVVDGVGADTLQPLVSQKISTGSIVCSDTWKAYSGITARG